MLKAGMNQIAQQITELGEAMRNPPVVSDRWNLLAEIQRFRTRLPRADWRSRLRSSSAVREVAARKWCPGYAEEV